MPATWPEGVPYQPLAGNVQVDLYRAPYQTEMESGRIRSRPRTTLNIATLSFTLRMSYTALAIFKPWVVNTLADGTRPFTASVWTDGGTFASRTCKFAQPPRVSSMNTDYADVAVTLDVENY